MWQMLKSNLEEGKEENPGKEQSNSENCTSFCFTDTKQRSPAGPAVEQGHDSSGRSRRMGAGKRPPR